MSHAARTKVAVVGAGALGGWTALQLARRGAHVTLVDAWGPGHARASSGGETRVIRRGYGNQPHYVPFVTEALTEWRALEERTGARLYDERGVLWMIGREAADGGAFEARSIAALEEARAPHERLDAAELARRFPAIRTDDLDGGLFEPEAGTLFARRACTVVWAEVAARGGRVRVAEARPIVEGGRCAGVELSDGTRALADATVFAAGPWLPALFPEALGPDGSQRRTRVTRQEVLAFGAPAGDRDHLGLPVWAEHGATLFDAPSFWYGIPGGLGGGFKLGEDTLGPDFDPTAGDRSVGERSLARARRYLAHRFPRLDGAPLIEARVCQYTQDLGAADSATVDNGGELLVDRHPELDGLWLVGAGSGHAFKLGPAIGNLVARALLDGADVPAPLTGSC